MRNEVPNHQRPFFESFERKMRCENCNKMEIPFLFPFWQMNDIFQVEKRATSCFTRRFMTERKEKRKKTVPAENLIIQRMRWCQVAWLEFESRALLIYDLSHSMKGTFLKIVFGESRGKAKYGTRPTHCCDWIWLNQFSCHTPRHTLNLNDKTNICLEDDEMRTH